MNILEKEISIQNCLEREWLITNGIGGYASSTVLGTNTRKYHGLLVASLTPPGRRHVILSKVDEALVTKREEHILYTNMCKNYISEGYKNQTKFEKDYIPEFEYKINDIIITKKICMDYGKNTVCILYKIHTKKDDCTLKLAPIMNFRDFHTMTTNTDFKIKQEGNKKVKVIINENSSTPVYMNISEGNYIEHENDIFYNMYYVEEEKRGFFPEENHIVPGVYEVKIPKNSIKEITFVCSLEENIEEINAKEVINKEIKRLDKIVKETKLISKSNSKEKNEFIKKLIIATDNFIVFRPSFALHTIIAGYPWFLDWGRDALISFEGLLLVTKRYDIAREVLLTFIKDIKFGLVPNGYSGFDNRPLYNSVDSSLLLFEQVNKYLQYTNDYQFIKEKMYDKLKKIISSYEKGIDLDDNNIYLDKDGLISSGTENIQNTWMDAKIGAFVVTPRNGKTVEINSMWYNALKILEKLSMEFNEKSVQNKCKKLAEKCKNSFKEKFYNKKRKCLYDVLGDNKIRPNQLFALCLTYPIIESDTEMAEEILKTATNKLLNNYGLKTLAKNEMGYVEIYSGDGVKRDMSYHQGITWPWLLGIYYDSYKKIINAKENGKEDFSKFVEKTYNTFEKEIDQRGCIGNIAEIYDSKVPYLPKGTIAQAWSVAEIFRIILNL